MKIIVTGGAGRLGRSVASTLAAGGAEVVVIDRTDPQLDGIEARTADLTDFDATSALFTELQPDAVVHLAAIAVPFSAPEHVILSTNQALAFNVLSAGVAAGARKLLAASSPTLIGYGAPHGWAPHYLPIDEQHPTEPWNAYALSKVAIEQTVDMLARQQGDAAILGAFRPCFVISPEEWEGAPTQQGHTLAERLSDPSLASVSLFNYVDARDAGAFVVAWLDGAKQEHSGEDSFVGADDALAQEPLSTLLPATVPSTAPFAGALDGNQAAFTSAKATAHFGWRPRYSWHTSLIQEQQALIRPLQSQPA